MEISSHPHAPASLAPEKYLGNPGIGAWMGPTARLVLLEKRKHIVHTEARVQYIPVCIIQFSFIQWVSINVQA